MSSLTPVEKQKLEALLQMGGGYVLDFTNATFQDFVQTSIGINVFDLNNTVPLSKARRLRMIWQQENDLTVSTLLADLLERWVTIKQLKGEKLTEAERLLHRDCMMIYHRLLNRAIEAEPEEAAFMTAALPPIDASQLRLSPKFEDVIKQRLDEIVRCLEARAPLAAIFLIGSTLEGVLHHYAETHVAAYNTTRLAPRDRAGKVKILTDWTLNDLIMVSRELDVVGEDVKKFSVALKDFRNYIHPRQQMKEQFTPDMHTAELCHRVLQIAIIQIGEKS